MRTKCQYESCGRDFYSRGLCKGHYEQARSGRPLKPLRPRRDKIYPCSFEGCENPSMAATLCDGHYQQKGRGQCLAPLQQRRLGSLEDRLWSDVDKNGPVPTMVEFAPGTADPIGTMQRGPCWLWTGLLDRRGYGRMWDGDRVINTHQIAYRVTYGVVPTGTELDHLCNTPACCNPDHLEPVTHAVNLGRENPRRTRRAS